MIQPDRIEVDHFSFEVVSTTPGTEIDTIALAVTVRFEGYDHLRRRVRLEKHTVGGSSIFIEGYWDEDRSPLRSKLFALRSYDGLPDAVIVECDAQSKPVMLNVREELEQRDRRITRDRVLI